jgi:DNA polymerase-1
MHKTTPLILIDGSSYLYRAYYAPPHLTNSKGEPTGAIFGVVNMLRSMLNQYNPSHIAVVFDAKGPTFRDAMYDQYKANRESMPDDLRQQIAPLHQIVRAMGLPLISIEGVEADDVIGTIATQAAKAGQATLISTGDKDLCQLVNDQVHIINTMTQTYLDPQGVLEKFGVKPENIIDYLALVGDTSDNIPGLPGVGPKTAQALINQLGDIDTLYQNLDAIADLSFRGAKTMAKKMTDHADLLELSKKLVTIKLDVALPYTHQDLKRQIEDHESLIESFQTLEFNKLMQEQQRRYSSQLEHTAPKKKESTTYECILTESALDEWLQTLNQAEAFAFDTETTGLNYITAELVGLSFAVKANQAAYVPLQHQDSETEQLDLQAVLAKLKPILENPKIAKIGQNLKYDMSILAKYGVEIHGKIYDTMLESYVLNATATRHNMTDLAKKYLERDTISFESIAGKGAKQKTFDHIDIETATEYAAEDADVTLQLHQALWPQLQNEPSLLKVYNTIEEPMIRVLSKIERQGVRIDADTLLEQGNSIEVVIKALEEKAIELAGESFNLSSTKQLQNIFFEKLGYPVIKKTPKGVPSTAEEVLIELALDYPLPKVILEHRSLNKLKNTYIDKLPKMIEASTGRVHTNYHQAVTATGRLSSSDPNLQNIPIRSEEGRRIRHAFVASANHCMVAADYSQVELRIMAHLSQDKTLIQAFAQGKDIHQATAAEVFNLPFDQVSSEQRRRAKAVNFGLIYGMSAFGLAKQLDISRQEAQTYINTYFERYPGVQDYMERTRAQAKNQGFVETCLGRRLYLPEIHAKNPMLRAAAERAAINAPMQGTAADVIKLAMIAIQDWLQAHPELGIKMIMQVHDELVFEVPSAYLEQARGAIKQFMESAVQLDVALLVEIDAGISWEEAH